MSEMEDKLNTLTPEELTALNNDPELLQAFKTKYGDSGHQTLMQKAKGMYQQYKQSPLYQASPQGMLETANNLVHKGADIAGEKTAETMAEKGTNPNVAAGVGTAIQMAPDIATAFVGGGAAKAGAEAGELGQAGRVISGPARKVAGEAMGAAERAAGINTEVVPSLNRMARKLELPKGQATVKDYITALAEKIKNGNLSKQDLLDHHKLLTDLLKDEPKGFAKMISSKPSRLGASGVAQAAKTDAKIVEMLNNAAPGRGTASANYNAAMTRNKIYKGVALGTAALAGKGKLQEVLNKAWGR